MRFDAPAALISANPHSRRARKSRSISPPISSHSTSVALYRTDASREYEWMIHVTTLRHACYVLRYTMCDVRCARRDSHASVSPFFVTPHFVALLNTLAPFPCAFIIASYTTLTPASTGTTVHIVSHTRKAHCVHVVYCPMRAYP